MPQNLSEIDERLHNLQNDLENLAHVQETTQLGVGMQINVGFGCDNEVFEVVESHDCHIDMVSRSDGDVNIWAKLNL